MSGNGPLRILVVEDDPGMALLVQERLSEVPDWDVSAAGSAAECRERMRSSAYDLVLLDRGLPDCDGALLITELLATHGNLAIVMLTGADSATSATETLKLGAWDYVVKRPDLGYLDELPATVRRCAERIAWRREEARLRGEMDLLLTAIRNAAEMVIMTDAEGRVRFWNAAAERLSGWRTEEIEGSPLPLIPVDRQEEFAEMGERARQGQPLVGVETWLQRRDGALVEVRVTLTAVCNPDGSVRAYVAVGHDISERRRLERDRADFAAMLTHDIKNPLTAILGCVAELRAERPEQDEPVAIIERSAQMINTLVGNFLIGATLEQGELKLVREPVAVAALLADCVKQFRAAAARGEVRLELETSENPVEVLGDRVQLERAVNNLIGNALEFTPPGGSVTVSVLERDGVAVRIRDTGPGIGPEMLPHVFDKYRRGHGGRKSDGAGLGLYITRSLIEAHGGTVSVQSRPGEGATFEIRLPASRGSLADSHQ